MLRKPIRFSPRGDWLYTVCRSFKGTFDPGQKGFDADRLVFEVVHRGYLLNWIHDKSRVLELQHDGRPSFRSKCRQAEATLVTKIQR